MNNRKHDKITVKKRTDKRKKHGHFIENM